MEIKTFGTYDEGTYAQIVRCATDGFAVLCADNQLGYSQPVGGAVPYREHISPSGVGYDIGCGNKAVLTNLLREDIEGDLPAIMDEVVRRVPFGLGRSRTSKIDGHPVLDKIRHADWTDLQVLYDTAAKQIGTVGTGNHYVDILTDELGRVWVGNHFGSRGFGYKTAEGFLALYHGLSFFDKPPKEDVHAPPRLLDVNTEVGQGYISAMQLAGEYAYAGRDLVADEVLDILGAESVYEVHNHHNYAWFEEHFGEHFWVVRKGCTPARPGQEGFVGGSMGDISVILVGNDTPENEAGLYSTVHGAGRAMSRNEAAGKFRNKKRYACQARDCDRVFQIDGISSHNPPPKKGVCPVHPEASLKKVWIKEQKEPGKVDWDAVRADLRARGIELRGGAADEAPEAYKRLPEVLAAHGDTITIKHTLTPVGVAMAGADINDPYGKG